MGEVDEVIENGKELEIEIARSEEEVGLAEEAEIENVSDDETDGIEIDGDSQSIVAGIEDVPQEETLEREGILEDNEDMAEDGKEESIESESEEESGEDLTESKRRASRMEESPPGLLRGSSTASLKCRQ